MKESLRIVSGLLAAGSSILFLVSSSKANEIEWAEVPGTQVSGGVLDDYEELIGTNTVVRNGSSINFDYLSTAHFNYARLAGNCSTGWLVAIAEGFYDENGNIVISSEVQRNFTAPKALNFACSQ